MSVALWRTGIGGWRSGLWVLPLLLLISVLCLGLRL